MRSRLQSFTRLSAMILLIVALGISFSGHHHALGSSAGCDGERFTLSNTTTPCVACVFERGAILTDDAPPSLVDLSASSLDVQIEADYRVVSSESNTSRGPPLG